MPRALVALLLFALLGVACTSSDEPDATPTASPAQTSSPSAVPSPAATESATSVPTLPTTASATAAPTGTSTAPPTPTAAPSIDATFCSDATPPADETGYYRREDCVAPYDRAFVTRISDEVDAALPIGAFVPDCFQRLDRQGVRVIVGRLCLTELDNARTRFTDDPLPADAARYFGDGDLIPYCNVHLRTDGSFEVGPPCFVALVATYHIPTADHPEVLEGLAACHHGLAYFDQLTPHFEDLAMTLEALLAAIDAGDPVATLAANLETTRAALAAIEENEWTLAYFEDDSPEFHAVMIKEHVIEDLSALIPALDTPPLAALESDVQILRDDIQAALDYFTAGYDC